jgi:hypothetical protein
VVLLSHCSCPVLSPEVGRLLVSAVSVPSGRGKNTSQHLRAYVSELLGPELSAQARTCWRALSQQHRISIVNGVLKDAKTALRTAISASAESLLAQTIMV